jgi:hypothetical protein
MRPGTNSPCVGSSLTLTIALAGAFAAAGCSGHTVPQPLVLETRSVQCGGSPGLLPPCPGAGSCVPDPQQQPPCPTGAGGSECVGKCQCFRGLACAQGEVFDSAPDVCACVPAPATPPPSKVACGGLAGTPCPGIGLCLDDPSDNCDPKYGAADCSGACYCPGFGCASGFALDASPAVCACLPTASR